MLPNICENSLQIYNLEIFDWLEQKHILFREVIFAHVFSFYSSYFRK